MPAAEPWGSRRSPAVPNRSRSWSSIRRRSARWRPTWRRWESRTGSPSTAAMPSGMPSASGPGRSTSPWPTPPTAARTPPAWWRSSAGPRSRAFFPSSTAPPSGWTGTRPAATVTPPSPSAMPHETHRDLPGLFRSTDEGPRGPDPPQPGAGRPGDRGRGREPVEAAALPGDRADRHAARDGGGRSPGDVRVVRRPAGGVRQEGGGVGRGARPARGERLRVRVPDGAHEPPAPSVAGDGVPGPGAGPDLPQLEPRARGGPLRRRRQLAGPPRRGRGAGQAVPPMSFRRSLLERAAARRKRVVLCEGDDPRVRAAAGRLRADGIAEPILLGGDGIRPIDDPRLPRIAQY